VGGRGGSCTEAHAMRDLPHEVKAQKVRALFASLWTRLL